MRSCSNVLVYLGTMFAHVLLHIQEMLSHHQKVSYTCILSTDFILILAVEDNLEYSLQKASRSKDEYDKN